MKGKKLLLTRFFFLITSLSFLGIGIWNEEFLIVLQKAVKICLECIGIG